MQMHTHPGTLFISVPLLVFGTLLGMMSGTAALAQSGDSDEEAVPDYRLLRQEEDWSPLRGQWKGPALKAVPLTADGPYLTVGGEARTYARWYRHQRWGGGPDRDGYLLQRFMLHGSVETRAVPALRARGFVQLKSGLVAARQVCVLSWIDGGSTKRSAFGDGLVTCTSREFCLC